MKRYLLFDGSEYYPGGGWSDFVGDFDDVESAKALAEARNEGWHHIIDTEIMDEITPIRKGNFNV